MKALSIRCPDCGAQLKAEKGLKECGYCGTSIMVGDGSRGDFDAYGTPGADGHVHGAEVAHGRGPAAAVLLAVGLVLLGAIIIGIGVSSGGSAREATAMRVGVRADRNELPKPRVARPTMGFEANHPIVRAVDSDDVADILGYFDGPDEAYYVGALSGKDGSLLWRSDAIPGLVGGAEPQVIVGSQVVLAATNGGDLTAYSLRDGGTLWTIRLAEVVSEIHELDAETAQVLLADKQVVHVGLERGALMAPPEGAAELGERLPSMNGWEHRGAARLERFSGSRTFGDVDAGLLVIADDGTFQVSMGPRREGTATPVLIRYEGEVTFHSRGTHTELWRTPVAGVEPLQARQPMGFGSFLHADGEFVCAAYHTVDKIGLSPTRFAAFDLRDGRRFWDQPIPEEATLTSLTVIDARIYVVTWKGLTVLDAKSGDTLFVVGAVPLD